MEFICWVVSYWQKGFSIMVFGRLRLKRGREVGQFRLRNNSILLEYEEPPSDFLKGPKFLSRLVTLSLAGDDVQVIVYEFNKMNIHHFMA